MDWDGGKTFMIYNGGQPGAHITKRDSDMFKNGGYTHISVRVKQWPYIKVIKL
jgi:hypothetical protein